MIATARNERDRHPDRPQEPSEIEKLQFEKYPDFWNRFYRYELEAPSDEAIVQLLSDRVEAAHLRARAEEFPQIARKNDRTFRNIVENLRTAANRESIVSVEGLSETLDRTWRVRYKEAVKRYPEAKYIYDAVEVMRSLDLLLHPVMVEAAAKLFVRQRGIKRFWRQVQIRRSLLHLAKQDILNPRDGQIEAKGQQVDLGKFITQVLRLLEQNGKKIYSPSALASELSNCGLTLFYKEQYELALESFTTATQISVNNFLYWILQATALHCLSRDQEAITSIQEAMKHMPLSSELYYLMGSKMQNTIIMRFQKERTKMLNEHTSTLKSILKEAHNSTEQQNSLLKELKSLEKQCERRKSLPSTSIEDDEAMTEITDKLHHLSTRAEQIQNDAERRRDLNQQMDNLLKQQELKLKENGKQYKKVIQAFFNKAAEIDPDCSIALYKKALSCSYFEETDEAVLNLQKAIALSYSHCEQARTDTGFNSIRNDDRFQALINENQNESTIA